MDSDSGMSQNQKRNVNFVSQNVSVSFKAKTLFLIRKVAFLKIFREISLYFSVFEFTLGHGELSFKIHSKF